MPDIYRRLGVRLIINARSTHTRLGGTLIRPEVPDAMHEAANTQTMQPGEEQLVAEALPEVIGERLAVVSGGEPVAALRA